MLTSGTTFSTARRLFTDHFRDYAPRYAIAFAFMAIFAGCTALSAWLMKDIINEIFVEKNQQALTWIPIVIIGVFCIKGFAGYFQEVMLNRIGNQLVAELQARAFDRLLSMNVAYYQKHPSSDLITRLTNSVRGARDMMNLLAVGLGRDLLTIIGLIFVMVSQDAVMSALCLLVGPIAVVGLKKLNQRIRKVAGSENESLSTIIGTMRETAQGIRIVKSFQLEDLMRARMQSGIDAVKRVSNRLIAIQASVNPLMETLGGLAVACVVLYAGWRSMRHGQTPGEFFAFITALLMAAEPARRLSRLQLQLTACATRVQALYTLLDTPAAEADGNDHPDLVVHGGQVAFSGVSFGYRSKTPILQDLHFIAPAGKTTALVGLSGSGKTTVLNLLQRFWVPEAGTISIDGQSITEVALASLRRNIALVSQDVFLFEGTVRENLMMARPGVSNADIVAAARAAHADAFISAFPNGYDTEVGELGGQLSGGQKQRLSIARAFLKDAPIILLDEPTSAVDSETEWHIQAALNELTRGRTTIIVAHRLATIANADLILVLEGGRLVESGTQRDLVGRDGLFARLHRRQFAGASA
jgi:ATP-binding cassette subfamily B protein